MQSFTKKYCFQFLSTPSARRATLALGAADVAEKFLSTPSARRATVRWLLIYTTGRNFYPRPPRGGRHRVLGKDLVAVPISIHALREEGDRWPRLPTTASGYFYPRPPRGGRLGGELTGNDLIGFLSTPSARRATSWRGLLNRCKPISIHALREEGDPRLYGILVVHIEFLSTPSARRATTRPAKLPPSTPISIHALREEGDAKAELARLRIRISIHALREEGDLDAVDRATATIQFLSTPSARRATLFSFHIHPLSEISIHALREEGDW